MVKTKKRPRLFLTAMAIMIAVALSAGCTPAADQTPTFPPIPSDTPEPPPLPTPTDLPPTPTFTIPPIPSTLEVIEGELLLSVYPEGDMGLIASDGSSWDLLVDETGRGEIFDNRQANWSPDGRRISYTVDDFLVAEIWVVNSDGSSPQLLFGDVKHQSTHAWSPDGGKIAYISTGNELCIFDLASRTVTPLSGISLSAVSAPDWSPDGSSIAFSARERGNEDIYTIHLEDMQITRITTHEEDDLHPDWSPDGTKIAFSSTRDGDRVKDIFVIDLNLGTEGTGNTPLQVSRNETSDIEPDWSPDGSQIAYASYELGAGHGHIFIVDAQGTAQFLVTEEPVYYSPKWKP